MYAIIKTGGKQYKVAAGEYLNIEKLDRENIIRLMDYLGGVIYVIEGKVKWSNSSSVIFAPKNVNISGIGEDTAETIDDEQELIDDYN